MDKNIQYNVYNYGNGKSLYNIDGSTSTTNQSAQTLSDFINGLQASSFSNISLSSSDASAVGILSVIQEIDFANGRLKVLFNQNPYVSGEITEDSDYVIMGTNSDTELIFKVPYIYPDPDHVPQTSEDPEKWFKIVNSKFQVTGPFAFINSQKTAFRDNIITLNYYDRVEADNSPTTILVSDTNDRGIDFEYVSGGNIQRGFMGYNKASNRWVFWSNAEYTGPNVLDTDNPEITIARTFGNINNFDLDVIYTNNINTADRTGISTLAITSSGTLSISTTGSSDQIIDIGGDISENCTNFIGTYLTEYRLTTPTVNIGYGTDRITTYNLNAITSNLSATSAMTISSSYAGYGIALNESNTSGGITLTSGTRGIIGTTTGKISLQTTDTTDGILIGTTSNIPITLGTNTTTISVNDNLSVAKYASIGTTLDSTRTLNIGRSFSGSGSSILSQIYVDGTITNNGNDVYAEYIVPTIVSAGSVSIISSLALSPPALTISSGSVANSSTLYIAGATTNATSNYSIYTASGSTRLIGSTTSNYVNWDATNNIFSVIGTTTLASITATNITTSGNASFGGTLSATGATTLSSTLVVNGSSTLNSLSTSSITNSGTLNVTGTSTLGTTNVSSLTDSGTLNVTGISTLGTINATSISDSGTLSVTGNTTLSGTLSLGASSNFAINTNKFTVAASSGNTVIAGTLNVTGISTLGTINATSISNSGTLSVTGNTTLSGTLSLGASSNFAINTNKFTVAASSGNTSIAGTLDVAGITTVGTIDVTTLDVSGNATVGGDLDVTGDITTTGALNITSIAVSGNISAGTNKFVVTGANGNLAINTNKFNVTGSNGNLTINTNKFTVTGSSGDTLIAGTLDVTGNFAVNTNKFTVTATTGNTLVAGTLDVTGNFAVNTNKFTVTATTGNTLVAGTLNITGDVAINTNKFTVTAATGNTAIAGNLAINTNKFTVASATGNTLVAGTLNVTGTSTLSTTIVPSIASTSSTMVRQPFMPYDEIMIYFDGLIATVISQTRYLANSYVPVAVPTGIGNYTFTFTPVTAGTRTFGNAYLVGFASDVNPSVVTSWTYDTPLTLVSDTFLFDSTGSAIDSTGIFIFRLMNSNPNNSV